MTWDGTDLWLTTDTVLFKMDTSGKVLGSYSVPEYTPEGLTWDGATFWLFTTNWGYIYQFSLDESDGVLKPRIISSFQSPNQSHGGGVYDDLAWDGAGTTLWYSDRFNVYRLDTAGNVLSSFALAHEIAGLAWDGEQLWLAYNPSGSGEHATFMKTDTEGNTLLNFSGLLTDVEALAWGDEHLWAVGKESYPGQEGQQLIYEIDLETIVVGLSPTPTPTLIELTPTATPTVVEPELGTYSGSTSQGRSVEFDVIEGSRAIGRIKFDVEGECPVPTSGVGPQPVGCTCEVNQETTMANPWPIANNAFSYAPGDFEFSAIFDSTTTASGFLRIHTSATPGGQTPCESGQVTWTASVQ